MSEKSNSSNPGAKRAFERNRLLDVIAMIWDEQDSVPIECTCRDASTGGILVESKEALPIGKHLRVSLHNRQNREHIGTLNTEVVRVQKNKWGGYNIGLEIIRDRQKNQP